MPLFYAYLKNRDDDLTWRYLITFSSREVADEWWRVVSTAPSPWATNIIRTTPQFYTHVPYPVLIADFFIRADFTIARQFLGKMFFTLLHDRDGRILSAAPPIDFTDHVSGNWFYIRSKSDPHRYWYSPNTEGIKCAVCSSVCNKIHVSTTRRTRYRIQIRNSSVPIGTIIIGTDEVTVSTSDNSFVVSSGGSNVSIGKISGNLHFGDFQTAFRAVEVANADGGSALEVREDIIRVAESGEPWELV